MRINIVRFIIALLFMPLLCSCNKKSNLEQALEFAGENRIELEKVLKHYSYCQSDSLKLRAAEFLIENMPGHWSLDAKILSAYYADIDSILSSEATWQTKAEQMNRISSNYSNYMQTKIEDIRMITADYLIHQIDRAFDVWQNMPWAHHVMFDDFCEYLLPYKVAEGQPFDNWRDSLKEKYGEGLQLLQYNEDYKRSTIKAATTVRDNFVDDLMPVYTADYTGLPLLAWNNIARFPAGTCNEFTQMILALMRSKGIPVVVDFIPQWPYKGGGGGHAWMVLCNEKKKNVFFEASNHDQVGSLIYPESKFGKVYRRTYAINRELLRMQSVELLPEFFRNVFFRDVTSEYAPVATVVIQVYSDMKSHNHYHGKVIGMKRMYRDDTGFSKEMGFDNDPLTWCISNPEDSAAWAGMDFGSPIQIEKIIFLPRSDDNNIRLGDEYELLYWEKDGWQSLGRQIAKEEIELRFERVPENALLLLHDLTRGKEERIFTCENGEQVWW